MEYEKQRISPDKMVVTAGDSYDSSNGARGREPSVVVARITKVSSILMVLVSGLALFSDGYNAQIIAYMNPLFEQLYSDTFSRTIKTRSSNAYLICEIFGMLFF